MSSSIQFRAESGGSGSHSRFYDCMEEAEQLPELPGPWQAMLQRGQVLTALLLSTSFSEKYKGRNMQPGEYAELRLPAKDQETRTVRPRLLHRSGNKEAVAFIWLGDEERDRTLYVAFSPLRFRSQFLKIFCAGDVLDGLELPDMEKPASLQLNPADGKEISVPISAYVVSKLRKLWGRFHLRKNLLKSVEEFGTHKVVFAGISHGAALAQAAALQFQLWCRSSQVYVVTWNAYRWTDQLGRRVVEEEFKDRILAFALSRRASEPQATRYWDSVTGFPSRYAPMPNMVLLDADTGHFLNHKDSHETMSVGAAFLMRMFELHFAKAAIAATKKATAAACGGDGEAFDDEEDKYLVSAMREKLQDRFLETSEKIAKASHNLKTSTREEYVKADEKIRGAVEQFKAARSGSVSFEQGRKKTNWWRYIVFCGHV